MSDYQYDEFAAVDRRLGEAEMRELRGYSSRAHITPTTFTNEYSFGNFKGKGDLWQVENNQRHPLPLCWKGWRAKKRVQSCFGNYGG